MNERFTIRLRPKQGESLSSYLFRVAKANEKDIRDILNYISIDIHNDKRGITDKITYLDFYTNVFINIRLLESLLDLSEIHINSMTTAPIIQKLMDKDAFSNIDSVSNALAGIFEIKYRRFCVNCLKENSYYKLIWQVKNIHKCNIHNTELQSKCMNCNKEIPYYADSLQFYVCPYCWAKFLDFYEASKIKIQPNKNQDYLYDLWSYILNNEKRPLDALEGCTRNKTMALKLLYLSELNYKREEFSKNSFSYLKKSYIIKLIRLIQDKVFFKIPLVILLEFLEYKGMGLEEFIQIQLPEVFIKSIKGFYDKLVPAPGACLSPWCVSYGSNTTIRVVNEYRFYTESHNLGSVCSKCYMKFGYNLKTKEWESIKDEVNLLYNRVKPLYELGFTVKSVSQELSIGRDLAYKVLGYLMYNKLLDNSTYNFLYTLQKPKDLVECFEILYRRNGNMQRNAYKLFGWSVLQYNYYLAYEEVQEFLLFKSYLLRIDKVNRHEDNSEIWQKKTIEAISECLKKDIEITYDNLSAIMLCSSAVFQRKGLLKLTCDAKKEQKEIRLKREVLLYKDKVEQFLKEKINDKNYTSAKEIYMFLGLYEKIIRYKYPDLTIWINEKVKKFNEDTKRVTILENKQKIVLAINSLRSNGERISYERIRKLTGISIYVIRENKELYELLTKI